MPIETPHPENVIHQIKPVEGKPGLYAYDYVEHDPKISAEIDGIINNVLPNNPKPIEKSVINKLIERIKNL